MNRNLLHFNEASASSYITHYCDQHSHAVNFNVFLNTK